MSNDVIRIISRIEKEIEAGPCRSVVRGFEVAEECGNGEYQVSLIPRDRRRSRRTIRGNWQRLRREIRRFGLRMTIRHWQMVSPA